MQLYTRYYPECLSYKHLARKCVGRKFEKGLEFLTCINWFMTMALYILTAVEAFQVDYNFKRIVKVSEKKERNTKA